MFRTFPDPTFKDPCQRGFSTEPALLTLRHSRRQERYIRWVSAVIVVVAPFHIAAVVTVDGYRDRLDMRMWWLTVLTAVVLIVLVWWVALIFGRDRDLSRGLHVCSAADEPRISANGSDWLINPCPSPLVCGHAPRAIVSGRLSGRTPPRSIKTIGKRTHLVYKIPHAR